MRLKKDRTNWNARSVIRRDFRHDPGLPETEVPKHRKLRHNKKQKHQHKWHYVRSGTKVVYIWYRRNYRVVNKWIAVCEGCGLRRDRDDFTVRRSMRGRR